MVVRVVVVNYLITPQATLAPPPPKAAGWSWWLSPPMCTINDLFLISLNFLSFGARTGLGVSPLSEIYNAGIIPWERVFTSFCRVPVATSFHT